MKKFTEEELVKLHECLKQLNIQEKLPSSKETDYYVDIINLLFEKVTMDERLAFLMFMSYETLFQLISERDLVSEKEVHHGY